MPTASPTRRRPAPPWLVLAIAWLILALYAFPGQMTQDSWDHLTEARKNVFTDGHPPAIDLLFRWLDFIIAGPFLMFAVQSVALLLGLYAIFRRTFAPRGAAWATLGCYVWPPIMMPMAMIWKDSLMAGFLALGLAGLFSAGRRGRLLGLAALFVATAMRYNAFAATLPLVVGLFEWRPGLGRLRRYALAFAAWLAITLAAFGVNRALTDQPMYVWQSSLALYDIVGTLDFVDGEYPDAELERTLAGTDLRIHHDIHRTMRAVYSPRNFLPIVGDPKLMMWDLPINGFTPAPPSVRDAVARAWWDVVTSHPGAYVQHRLAVTREVMSFGDHKVPGGVIRRDAFHWQDYVHQMGQGTGWSPLQGGWTWLNMWIWRHTPIYIPGLYVVVALILLGLARRDRDLFVLVASGLVFESTLILLAPSTDYRYSHWLVVTTCVAVVALTARRARARRAAQRAPGSPGSPELAT